MADRLAVTVLGAAGRMGQEIIKVLASDTGVRLAAAIERDGHAQLGSVVPGTDIKHTAAADVAAGDLGTAIAFTSPAAISATIKFSRERGLPLVLGTSGASEQDGRDLDALAEQVPVLVGANMSLGVNILFQLVKQAARLLPHWDAEVFDIHHRAKVDAPSGTAVRIGEILRTARDRQDQICADRTSRHGPRPDNEIGMAIMRAGDVVGEHTVLLAGTGERLELTHRSTSRSNFAAGAVHAAKFLAGKPAGRYSMDDLLGLNS